MRLVSEVKIRCHIGQPGKASGFDEVDRCIKALHPKIRLRGQSYCLSEAPFKLAFREMERVEQVFDTQRTNVHIDQTEAFLHKQISRFRLLEQSQQEGGEKRHLFLPAAGFHQLTCQIERPILLWTYPPGSKERGVDPKEGVEGARLENHMHCCKSRLLVCHDAWLDH